jgi:hypothetical protein
LSAPINKELENDPSIAGTPARCPLIVHIRKMNHFLEVCGDDFFLALRDAVAEYGSDVLVVLTEDRAAKSVYRRRTYLHHMPTYEQDSTSTLSSYPILPKDRLSSHVQNSFSDSRVLWATGQKPRWEAIELARVGDQAQKDMFNEHRDIEACYKQENIRYLQRIIRSTHCTAILRLELFISHADRGQAHE